MSSVGANRYDNSAVRRERLLVVWNQEEDDLLREQVRLHGVDKWAKIATHFHGKTSRQCRRRMRVARLEGVLTRGSVKRNRWHMFLNVVNKRGGWTDEEDRLLLESHERYGNRWTEIAKKLPGRTDNAVKNRYCVLCKKQARETETTVTGASSEEGAQHPDHHRDAQIPEPQEYKATEGLTSVTEEARTDANFHNWASESSQYPIQQREELISTVPPPYMNAQLWNALQTELHGRPSSAENSQGIHHSRRRGEGDMTSETLYPQTSNCYSGNMQQWEGFLAAVEAAERTSEAGPSDTSQFLESSHAAVTNSSSQPRRPLVDTSFIQQGKRPKIGEAGVGSTHHNRGLVPLSSSKPPNVLAELIPQQGSVDGVEKRWNESDVKAMMSSSTYRGRNVLQDFEGCQKSLAGSSDENIEADENLAPLNGMNSTIASSISGREEFSTFSGYHGRSIVLCERQIVIPEPPDRTKERSRELPAAKRTCIRDAHYFMPEQSLRLSEWNCNQAMSVPVWDGRLTHDTVESGEAQIELRVNNCCSNKVNLPAPSTSIKSEVGNHSTANLSHHQEAQQLNRRGDSRPDRFGSSNSATSSCCIIYGQQWEGIATTRRKRFGERYLTRDADSSPNERLQQMVSNVEKLRGPLRQLKLDDRTCSPSWASRTTERTSRTSLKKSVFVSADICGDIRRGCDGEGVIFHAFMPYAPMADDLRHEIKVPVTCILKDENPCVLKTNSKRSETREQSPCGGPLGVAASTSRHEECQDGPSGLKAEEVYEETMQATCTSAECPPTPDKDRLLTQEIRLADCGSNSPVRPHSQYVRAVIPLIESRYDTPARSPLSSCLLPTVQSIHTVLRLG